MARSGSQKWSCLFMDHINDSWLKEVSLFFPSMEKVVPLLWEFRKRETTKMSLIVYGSKDLSNDDRDLK